jgi:hypothetical protein
MNVVAARLVFRKHGNSFAGRDSTDGHIGSARPTTSPASLVASFQVLVGADPGALGRWQCSQGCVKYSWRGESIAGIA